MEICDIFIVGLCAIEISFEKYIHKTQASAYKCCHVSNFLEIGIHK